MTALADAPAGSWVDELRARFAPPPKAYSSPGDLARKINPKTVQTEALDLIDEALVRAANTPDARLIISMPPQEGKSVRVAGDFPTWLLTRNPDLRIVVASYGASLAIRNGRAIRARITAHPELGLRVAADQRAVGEWTISGRQGGVFSVGVGGGLTGRPADVLIIDDPIKNLEEAESEAYRESVWDWWRAVAGTRLAPGAPVVIILTRWHDEDLAGKLLAEAKDDPDGEQWEVINIPAQADHKPADGETDPLGREPGQYLRSARGRTLEQWAKIRRRVGARVWAALYQGNPAPADGQILPRENFNGTPVEGDPQPRRYREPLWVVAANGTHYVPDAAEHGVEIIQSWDLAFKDTKHSDYVVGHVWLRRGAHVYLLDSTRARRNFVGTLEAFRALTEKWPQAILKLVEDKANGPALIDSLSAEIGGIVPVEPRGSKIARASAISPYVEAGNVHLPSTRCALFDVEELLVEAERFPNGSHDDQVDALTQALDRLFLAPLLGDDDGYVDSDDYLAASGYDNSYLDPF